MPIDSFSAESAHRWALDLAWSLWTELGVSGQRRRHSEVGVDLEPLIVATAYLSRFDARLRDESLDWCVLNVSYVSSDRLRNFAFWYWTNCILTEVDRAQTSRC